MADAAPSNDGTIVGAIGEEPPGAVPPDAPATAQETANVAALRTSCADALKLVHADDAYWASDHFLARVLVARKQDLAKSEAMVREIVAFRNERQCWRFLDKGFYKEPEAMRRFFSWGFAGVDRDGFPILVERVGLADLIGLHEAVGTDEFLRWVIYYHELQERMMREASAALGRNRHKMTVIVDLRGYNMRLASPSTLAVLHKRTRLEEDHYPEVVRRIFIINTPSLFMSCWGIVAYFMDEGTRNKVQLLGASFFSTLAKYIAPDNLPAFLGGQLADCRGDPECRSIVSEGGLVPLAFTSGIAADGNGAGEEVTVGAGKSSEVVVRVRAGAEVKWAWGTAEKDVGFSARAAAVDAGAALPAGAIDVTFAETSSVYGVHRCAASVSGGGAFPATGIVEIVPAGGARTNKGVGSWAAPASAAGGFHLVSLRWDNTFSWMTGKTVARRVDVLIGDRGAAASRAEDPGDVLARERELHREKVGEWVRSRA